MKVFTVFVVLLIDVFLLPSGVRAGEDDDVVAYVSSHFGDTGVMIQITKGDLSKSRQWRVEDVREPFPTISPGDAARIAGKEAARLRLGGTDWNVSEIHLVKTVEDLWFYKVVFLSEEANAMQRADQLLIAVLPDGTIPKMNVAKDR